MKSISHLFARRLAMTLLALFTTTLAWAQTQVQLGAYTYDVDDQGARLIQTAADWNALADYVEAGNNCSGLSFKMTANIGTTDAPITKPLGRQVSSNKNDRKRFAGNFNGNGYMLTINLNTTDSWWQYNQGYCAPFAYTQNATITNLHVAGTITTTGQWASGLVGSTGDSGSGTCTINNCEVSVTINSHYTSNNSKYANHGGFIGIAEGSATITNSWFDGKFLGIDYQYSAGFIGINKGTATKLNNCLFNPSEINIENNNIEGSCELVHSLSGGCHTFKDAYWCTHFGEPENVQGKKVVTALPEGTQGTSVVAPDNHIYYIITSNTRWVALQNNLTTSGTYNLTEDIAAGTNNTALVVPNGVTVTLNMNGHTIDRSLALDLDQAKKNGYVIKVEEGGTLTINGGTIMGGHNTTNGGGIYNAGTLNINGTAITGNKTCGHGGGIYNVGALNINSASITDNFGKQHGNRGVGVYVAGGTFNAKGNVQIHDNYHIFYNATKLLYAHNVYLSGTTLVNIAGGLDSQTSIGVEGHTGFITNNLGNQGNHSCFSSDDDDFGVFKADGEVKMAEYVNITVKGYGSGNGKWMFIASPVADGIAPNAVGNLMTDPAGNYDLFGFNQSGTNGVWENFKATDADHHPDFTTLVNGRGYLYGNKNKVVLHFLGDYNEEAEKTITLVYDENAPRFKGYNLVGNPFPVKAYASKAYYKMNAAGTGIEPVSNYWEAANSIAPCTGVIVKADFDQEPFTFRKTAPQAPANGDRGNLQIALAQVNTRDNALLDKAIVSFNEGSELGKFYFSEQDANIYIPQGTEEYAIVSVGKDGVHTISALPVNFKAKKDGEYTLTITPEGVEMEYLHLIDNMTGADVDLLQTESYTFNASTTDYASRFKLVFNAQQNDDEHDDSFAYVSNGQIIVDGEGTIQVVDMTGRVLVCRDAASHVSTTGMASGVYVLRLIDGDKVRTQKIIIK